MLNGLDLFSGIGGLSVALSEWVRPVAYCEIDPYCQGVLLSRMSDGSLNVAPIWDDVRTLPASELPSVDIIYGGFPCQDISVAGRGQGLEGERSGLFSEIRRLCADTWPTFVFLENVPAIRTRGGERVVKELASLGYDCRWGCLSAYDVGAPHKRERWFLLAYRNGDRFQELAQRYGKEPEGRRPFRNDAHGLRDTVPDAKRIDVRDEQGRCSGADWPGQAGLGNDGASQLVADASSAGWAEGRTFSGGHAAGGGWWAVEPDVGRVADGVPKRVDRLRALGNAVVPAQAREAFKRLMGL